MLSKMEIVAGWGKGRPFPFRVSWAIIGKRRAGTQTPLQKISVQPVDFCTRGENGIRNEGGVIMNEEYKDVKKITVTYEDDSEEVIERGVVFSVVEDGEILGIQCHGRAGSEEDVVTVLAIVSRIAKEMGIGEDLVNKVEQMEERG